MSPVLSPHLWDVVPCLLRARPGPPRTPERPRPGHHSPLSPSKHEPHSHTPPHHTETGKDP